MPSVSSTTEAITEASIGATVIRCGCGDPLSHARLQLPCPTPRATEPLGTIAYYHKNPLRRWLWEMRRAWKEGRS